MRQHLVQGDPAPDFTLKTPHDVEISLHPTLLKGPVLLEFIRGTWDPASRERIAELAASRPARSSVAGTGSASSKPSAPRRCSASSVTAAARNRVRFLSCKAQRR